MSAKVGVRRARRGLTLVELLLVMGVLGVLMGVGVGLLSSMNLGHRAARGLVQNVIRAARNSALARGAGARVRIDPNAGTILAEATEVVGTWHFEGPGEVLRGAFEVDGANQGALYADDGFVGKSLVFTRGSQGRAVVPVHQYSPYDFHDGFRIEFALRLEDGGGGRVLRLGETIGIDVTDAGGLRAWFVTKALDATGKEVKGGRVVFPLPAGSLPVGAWRRIAFEYDRRRVRVSIDGVDIEPEEDVNETLPVWYVQEPMLIGDAQAGFVGSIDSLVIGAVAASESITLPEGVRFDPGAPAEIRFDAGGNLDRAVHAEPLVVTLIYEDGNTAPVRIGMYGNVE